MAGVEDHQWPPRSPFEAILSSPSGRKKLQQREHRLSPSPSPVKRELSASNARKMPDPQSDDELEEEDEETLQLKLQALEAKLKLKKLQIKKAKDEAQGKSSETDLGIEVPSRAMSRLSERRNGTSSNAALYRSKSAGDIQIPLSPERRPIVQQEQKSPGRILLGIDKGLTARNVSLRRPPSIRNGLTNADPFGTTLNVPNARTTNPNKYLSPSGEAAPPMSFNERMAQARNREKTDKERSERLSKFQSERSTGFKVRSEEIAAFKDAAASAPTKHGNGHQKSGNRAFSREEVLNAANKPSEGLIRRSNTTSSMREEKTTQAAPALSQRRPESAATSRNNQVGRQIRAGSISLSDESRPATPRDPGLFEGFSRTNLSARVLPHSFVSRMLEDKAPATLPLLLRDIKAPDFELPPNLIEKDLVVFAVVAAKSEPRAHKQINPPSKSSVVKTAVEAAAESTANENGNYMIFTLTDLKWSVELFLFQTAYTRWHKLQPGTLIAILNPSIMAPPKGRADTGRWSLTLNSSDDTVLEIGTSKDLGWCKAKTKDGRNCSDWVDTRRTEFCDYHVNRGVEGLRRGRMEVQGMSAPFGPGGKSGGGSRYLNSMRGRGSRAGERDDGLLKEGRQFDRNTHSSYFMVSRNATAASLLDADEAGDLHGTREERQRKLHAAEERERDIARKLTEGGSGAGADYLRARNGLVPKSSNRRPMNDDGLVNLDAKSLGLRDNHATNVMLSPLKRKPSIRTVSNSNGDLGPPRKKTRFITEKGIREAGRDSIGGEELTTSMHDDDELDIV